MSQLFLNPMLHNLPDSISHFPLIHFLYPSSFSFWLPINNQKPQPNESILNTCFATILVKYINSKSTLKLSHYNHRQHTCNLSRYWGWPCPLFMVPVSSKSRSASVDLPWSTWAIMEKFLILSVGYWLKSMELALSLLFWREWEQKAWWFHPNWVQLSLLSTGLTLFIADKDLNFGKLRVFEALLK